MENQTQNFYNSIGRIWCPKLNAYVSFNNIGFRHLIWKAEKRRPQKEQKRRLALLPYAATIIGDPRAIITRHERIESQTMKWQGKKIVKNSRARFWAFAGTINGHRVRLIVRQLGGSNKHFFSIFQEKKQKTPH